MTKVTRPEHMPQSEHWVIIEFTKEHHFFPAYERNEKDEVRLLDSIEYYVFLSQKQWEKRIQELEIKGDIKYHAVKVSGPAKVSREIVVTIQ